MFGIAHQDAFRLLRKKRLLSVLQSDSLGVICKLTDAEGQPFHIKAKKIRRMLAGKQYRALCVSGENGDGNAFFARSDELVALDPLDGRYVILSPLLEVLNTEHGDRVFSGNANQESPPPFKSYAPGQAPCASTAHYSKEAPCPF